MPDELLDEARALVLERGWGGASLIQRVLRVGFARACRILDALSDEGTLEPADGMKARGVRESGDPDPCEHYSESGDEGPMRDLGRWPTRWRCDGCDRVRHEDPCLCDECKPGASGEGSDA